MRSLDRVQWQQWVRARPWPVWAAAGAVFALFAVLGAVTRGPAPAPVAAHSLADAVEDGGGTAPAPTGSATADLGHPQYPGVAYPTGAESPATPLTPAPSASVAAYYDTCAAAEAAGVAPMRRGQSGYRAALDRDGDGIACDADTSPSSHPATPSRTPVTPVPTVPSPTPDPTPTVTETPTPTPSPTEADPGTIG